VVNDQESGKHGHHETLDKRALTLALTAVGVGMAFLLGMMVVFFPELIQWRALGAAVPSAPVRIAVLHFPVSFAAPVIELPAPQVQRSLRRGGTGRGPESVAGSAATPAAQQATPRFHVEGVPVLSLGSPTLLGARLEADAESVFLPAASVTGTEPTIEVTLTAQPPSSVQLGIGVRSETILGVVKGRAADLLIVVDSNGRSHQVLVTEGTTINGERSSVRAMTTHDQVRVEGTLDPDGVLRAQNLRVLSAGADGGVGTSAGPGASASGGATPGGSPGGAPGGSPGGTPGGSSILGVDPKSIHIGLPLP